MATGKYITAEIGRSIIMDHVFLRKFDPHIISAGDTYVIMLCGVRSADDASIWGFIKDGVENETALQNASKEPSTENLGALLAASNRIQTNRAPARELRD